MPASGFEGIDGIDDDVDKEQGQDPPVIRHGTATSSYDVYMIDTLKKPHGNDKGDPVKTPETQSKFRRPKRRPKPRRSNDGTGENSTRHGTERNEDPVGATFEQDEQENWQASPDKQALHSE